MIFPPNRTAGLDRLEAFVPDAARYAGKRNFDLGAGKHDGVSRLSPYLRTRLITEEECTRAVLRHHSPSAAEKFLQEIAWRTYWKGWLEIHPTAWSHYKKSLNEQEKTSDYFNAITGNSGIECLDHWTKELIETGYLHNHARMWFASIWIFTLQLPWQLGADFFLKHLLDGDPASNTLSWRWVAGLHTPGKHYLARADNIAKFTLGRFDPRGQLNEKAHPIPFDQSFEHQHLILPPSPKAQGRIGHLMFPEDLAAAPEGLGKIHACAVFFPENESQSDLVTNFLDGAIQSIIAEHNATCLEQKFATSLSAWIEAEKLDSIIISQPTVGFTKDFLSSHILPPNTHYFVRSWDRLLWPHATAGFFKFKAALPNIQASLAPARTDDLFPHV